MDKIAGIIVGALSGVGQFFMLRYTLKPLAEGRSPKIGWAFILRMLIPFVLLLGCAFINSNLLPFAGCAFCLSLVITTVANHLITFKKKG